MAGAAAGLSLINGGPAPNILSTLMYHTLMGGHDSVIVLEDIADWNVREKLAKVHCSSMCFLSTVLIHAIDQTEGLLHNDVFIVIQQSPVNVLHVV